MHSGNDGIYGIPNRHVSNFDLTTIQSYWLLGLEKSSELPRIATEAILQGFDSKSLVLLAGLTQTECENANACSEKRLGNCIAGRWIVRKRSRNTRRVYVPQFSGRN
jgi:hypothetical protein